MGSDTLGADVFGIQESQFIKITEEYVKIGTGTGLLDVTSNLILLDNNSTSGSQISVNKENIWDQVNNLDIVMKVDEQGQIVIRAFDSFLQSNPNVYLYQVSFNGVSIESTNPGYLLMGTDTIGADVFGIQNSQFIKIRIQF